MSKKVELKPTRELFHKIFKIICFILILAIIFIGAIYGYSQIKRLKLNKVQATLIPNTIKKIITNPETKIRSIENLQEVSGVYEFILKLETNDKKSNYVIFMTKDGQIVFTSGIKITDLKSSQNSATSSGSPINSNEKK